MSYLRIHDPDILFYGEPSDEDEAICDRHGCRLRWHRVRGWVCDSCLLEDDEEERAEMEIEYARREKEAFEEELRDREPCRRVVIFKAGTELPVAVGFSCQMPWWA